MISIEKKWKVAVIKGELIPNETTQMPMSEQIDKGGGPMHVLEYFSTFNMCKILIDAYNIDFK